MKKILIFLSLLYLTSCTSCIAPTHYSEPFEDCKKREASYGKECCHIMFKGKYFNQQMNGYNCIEIKKTMKLKDFARQYESVFKKDGLHFKVISCPSRTYLEHDMNNPKINV